MWRGEVDDRPGALADVLRLLAAPEADLQVVMGYRKPGDRTRAVLELWPASGRKPSAAARRLGFAPSPAPTLLVSGDNRAGLGHVLTRALADAGISLSFLVAQVAGRKYSAVFGFETEAAAASAAAAIRKASRQ